MNLPYRLRHLVSLAFAAAAGVLLQEGLLSAELKWQDASGYRWRQVAVQEKGRAGFTRLSPEATGINFTNVVSDAAVARNRILENGSGVALGDVDGDGWCD